MQSIKDTLDKGWHILRYVLSDINYVSDKLSRMVWLICHKEEQYTTEEYECVKQLLHDSNALANLKQNITDLEIVLKNKSIR